MSRHVSRRSFLAGGAAAGALAPFSIDAPNAHAEPGPVQADPPKKPVSISSGNGLRTTARAVELMGKGEDTLEAAISGVNIVEADPNDMSVGYGGLPNEDGVVELDSCVMHRPSYNAGSVA